MKIKPFKLSIITAYLVAQGAYASITFSGIAVVNTVPGSDEFYDVDIPTLIVVDTNQDGFFAQNDSVLNIGDSIVQGDFLGGSDDFILAVNGTQGNAFFSAVPGNATNFETGNGVTTGDAFAIIVFDSQFALDTTITMSGEYTFYTSSDWLIPNDGDGYSYSSTPGGAQFQQLSASDGQDFQIAGVIPEPSTYAGLLSCAMFGFVYWYRKR